MPTNAKTCPEVTLFTTGTKAFAVYSYCVTSPSHSRLAALHTNYFVILKVALAIGLLSSQILPNSQEELTTKTIFLPIPEDKKKCCVSFSAVCWSGFLFSMRFILLDLAILFLQRDLLLPWAQEHFKTFILIQVGGTFKSDLVLQLEGKTIQQLWPTLFILLSTFNYNCLRQT